METDEMENMEAEAESQTEHKFKDIFKKAKLLVTLKVMIISFFFHVLNISEFIYVIENNYFCVV